ncbi:MAG TPA: ribosome maturation factor RimP [Polyangiaceae bacterium]|jgi:ribosome maturation factor RimP|nr:ribosome maturation factor RimP [Polyangiaceae bacterium]
MNVAHTRLPGLNEDRVLAVVVPVLRAHGVDAVELIWRTDRGGWVLQLTVERPNTRVPGEGITVDLCSEISRDLSAALDVAEVIHARYHLEVGSPGLERALYSVSDYQRFAGQLAKFKLREAVDGQRVARGTLQGMDDSGSVVVETERGLVNLDPSNIESAQLLFDWNTADRSRAKRSLKGAPSRGRGARGTQR